MPHTDTVENIQISINTDLAQPPEYRVIYVNDEVTSFDFVISSLVDIFNYPADAAERMAVTIHQEGSGLVAVMPYEIAEQKSLEVLTLAKLSGYPLVVRVEPHV
jgi:ATP-dependent Clp protease adaptor protein ClpS